MPLHNKGIPKRDKRTPLARVQDRELLEMRDEGFLCIVHALADNLPDTSACSVVLINGVGLCCLA